MFLDRLTEASSLPIRECDRIGRPCGLVSVLPLSLDLSPVDSAVGDFSG